MKWLSVIVFSLCCGAAFSQHFSLKRIDTLKRAIIQLKPGHEKSKIEIELFRYYLNSDAKQALVLANTGLQESKQLKNDSITCDFLDFIGQAYIYLEDSKSAIAYLTQDLELAQKIGYKPQIALAYNDLSAAYQHQSDYSSSQSCSFKALNLYEQLRDYRHIGICDFNIGVTYFNNEDFNKAIIYGRRALEVTKKSSDKDVIPNAYTLIGSSCLNFKKNAEAQRYFHLALDIYIRSKNDYGKAIVLSQLVSTYPVTSQQRIETGLQAQQLWDKIAPENFYSIYNLGSLGSTFGRMAMRAADAGKQSDLYKKAAAYLSKAIALAQKTSTKSAVIDLTDSLSIINAARGDYRSAYKNLKLSHTLYDSVYSQDNKNKIASLEGAHEIALRDKELQINKLELAGRRKQLFILLGGLIALIIIAALIYTQSLQRKKNNFTLKQLNDQLDEANKIKTRFFNILNHDLRAPVSGFLHFLRLQQKAPDLVSDDLRARYSAKMTESAAHLLNTMEDLLLWSKGQMENFKPQLTRVMVADLFAYILQTFEGFAAIQFIFDDPDNLVLETDGNYLKTIIYNLTSNAVKALANTNNGMVVWKAWQQDGAKFLSITDNGPGTQENSLRALYDDSVPIGIKNGLGLHIVRDLAKAINCEVKVDVGQKNGITILLIFRSYDGG